MKQSYTYRLLILKPCIKTGRPSKKHRYKQLFTIIKRKRVNGKTYIFSVGWYCTAPLMLLNCVFIALCFVYLKKKNSVVLDGIVYTTEFSLCL